MLRTKKKKIGELDWFYLLERQQYGVHPALLLNTFVH